MHRYYTAPAPFNHSAYFFDFWLKHSPLMEHVFALTFNGFLEGYLGAAQGADTLEKFCPSN